MGEGGRIGGSLRRLGWAEVKERGGGGRNTG